MPSLLKYYERQIRHTACSHLLAFSCCVQQWAHARLLQCKVNGLVSIKVADGGHWSWANLLLHTSSSHLNEHTKSNSIAMWTWKVCLSIVKGWSHKGLNRLYAIINCGRNYALAELICDSSRDRLFTWGSFFWTVLSHFECFLGYAGVGSRFLSFR